MCCRGEGFSYPYLKNLEYRENWEILFIENFSSSLTLQWVFIYRGSQLITWYLLDRFFIIVFTILFYAELHFSKVAFHLFLAFSSSDAFFIFHLHLYFISCLLLFIFFSGVFWFFLHLHSTFYFCFVFCFFFKSCLLSSSNNFPLVDNLLWYCL